MKSIKAIEIMGSGKETTEYYNNFKNMETEINEGFKDIQKLQLHNKLGEVRFNYYSETGKTVTLSIGFMDYFTVLNDIDMELLEYDNDDEVEFGLVSIMYEDEGDTYNESYYVDLKKQDFKNITKKYKKDVEEFFKVSD